MNGLVVSTMAFRRGARIAALACILAGASACQPGHGGTLEPAAGQMRGPDGPYGGGSVSMVSNGIDIRVSGNWRTSRGNTTFDLQAAYRNLGDRTVVLDATDFGIERGQGQGQGQARERGEVMQVVDMTGVDLADDRSDNDAATQVIDVYEKRRRGTIRLAPGERRLIEVSAVLPEDIAPLDDGQAITVFVPTVRGIGEARFEMDSGWF